ncbi:MAG: peptide-N4-asparagine amidase [Candidatus Tumulicola sp.]
MRRICAFRLHHAAAIVLVAALGGCGGHNASGSPLPIGAQAQGRAARPLSIARGALKIRDLTRRGLGDAATRAGSAGYPVTADPKVSHPDETPCVDVLFTPHTPPLSPSGLPVGTFADYSDHPFNYAPPSNCPGPYAKIVFKMHFSVSAGVQYDRTGAVWIGATNVFFGTTSEPGSNASPEWNVERDVTEYAPVFAQSSVGQASVYNIVNSQYTGVIYGRAELDFYPATAQFPAGQAADAVYPLSAGPTGGYVYLDDPSSQMTGTFTFPTNVEAAYLDVFLESQSGDEFWYSCFPNDLAQKLDNCGGTAFREGEVSVDGQPAGVAPIYPWIYTGGIDPYLWVPTPGVETLNFKPYRIDLTPFAAQLDDGNPHTVAVSVFNDNNYFAGNAALLVYQDHGSSQVTGALVSDGTAIAPAQSVVEHVKIDQYGDANGSINVSATHPVSLKGYVNTSHGRVTTSVTQSIAFSNVQNIVVNSAQYKQNIKQLTTITSDTLTSSKRGNQKSHAAWLWPFGMKYLYAVQPSGNAIQNATIAQTKNGSGLDQRRRGSDSWLLQNSVNSSDTLTFTSSGFSPSNGKSSQIYKSLGVAGRCYQKTIKSKNYAITSTTKGC